MISFSRAIAFLALPLLSLQMASCTAQRRAQAAEVPATYAQCLRSNALLDQHRREVMATIYLLEHEDPLDGIHGVPTPPPNGYDCKSRKWPR
ncbi:MAG TPA: hypothetical protein VGZ02_05250 [Candidatus Baltobacteraceae bacterium]|jgi:hypothetical protein|nr:hypothetical protein [Candidatus Baltobacteraceae bacterium]